MRKLASGGQQTTQDQTLFPMDSLTFIPVYSGLWRRLKLLGLSCLLFIVPGATRITKAISSPTSPFPLRSCETIIPLDLTSPEESQSSTILPKRFKSKRSASHTPRIFASSHKERLPAAVQLLGGESMGRVPMELCSTTRSEPLASSLFLDQPSIRTFDPHDIQILMNPDIDIVYHTLAYFSVPGDPSNLFSLEYIRQIKKAKQNLETGDSKLDQFSPQLEKEYREMPSLRFLNLAPFMADDYASLKQALSSIDFDFRSQTDEDIRESPEERKAKSGNKPILFGNSRRLIPLLKNRFPDPAEHQFLKQFAECMDDERAQFYRTYREVRTELDQQGYEGFMRFWKADGLKMLFPWAQKSNVNVFNIYLCPVIKRNGRGVPVNQEQRVLFNIVAPLPENSSQAVLSFFIVLHETTHRLTDNLVEARADSKPDVREAQVYENAAFYADHVYLKNSFPQYDVAYMTFFLSLDHSSMQVARLESEFMKSYPVSDSLKRAIEQLVKSL
jgi:hypothetical protein